MAFVDTLKQRNTILGSPAGSTFGQEAYFGQPPIGGGFSGGASIGDFINAENQRQFNLRNRDITDFAAKTRIAGDEAIRQENMRRIFDPNSGAMTTLRPQNTIYQPSLQEQGQITPIDRAKIDLAREQMQGTGLERAKFGLAQKEYELDKTKNDQIYGTKQADMQRKAEEAESRLKLAYDKLQLDQNNAQNVAAYRDAQMAATNARMELMNQQHAAELAETKRYHDMQMKKMRDDLDVATNSETRTVVDENGQEKFVTTRKGTRPTKKSAREGYVRVIGPGGVHGDWPADKPLPNGYTHIGE